MNGQTVALDGHVPEVIEGFRAGYGTLMQQSGALSRALPDLFQGVLNPVVVRVVVRDTRLYHDLLDWLTSPDLLVSGSAQAGAMQRLADMPSSMAQLPPGLVEEEMTALWQRDIPRFTARADSCDLRACSGRVFNQALGSSGTQALLERLGQTGLDDREWQAALLGAAFAVVAEPAPERARHGSTDGELDQRLLALTTEIGHAIERQAVRGYWGATWLLLAPTNGSAVNQHAAGLDLYAGTPGVALVLATFWQRSGEDRFAILAREALDYAHRLLAMQRAQGLPVSCSAYEGWLSVAWADMACGVLLRDAALMDRAQALALATPLAVFENETSIDFIGGAAGAIGALLAIHQHRPSAGLLARCHALAQVIAKAQLHGGSKSSEVGGWRLPQLPHPVLGMGHGASGICHALAALYKVTGEVSILEGLQQGLAFEARHFNPGAREWPDLRSAAQEAEPSYMVGWCAGACGAGMARLRLTDLLKTQAPATLPGDIEAAIDATLAALKSGEGGDHLCCGEAGRILFLMEAAEQARRPELAAAARDAAQAMLNRFEFGGTLELQDFSERLTVPSLMGGMGGIALAMLWASGKPGAANPLTLQIK
jgi:type 2 lantibiotic biosynthesis protein LanM